jgi:hypothetical protein
VRVIHQGALGAAAARAAGMRAVKGDFTHFVDDDDWMDLNMEEEMLKAQRKSNADIVICAYYAEHKNATKIIDSGCGAEGVFDREKLEQEKFPHIMHFSAKTARGVWPQLWTKLFRSETCRDAILRVSPRITKNNDLAACYEALYAADKITFLREAYYHHRVGRPGNISTSRVKNYYESMLALLEHLLSSPMAQNPRILKQIPYIVRVCLQQVAGRYSANGKDTQINARIRSLLAQTDRKIKDARGSAKTQRHYARVNSNKPAAQSTSVKSAAHTRKPSPRRAKTTRSQNRPQR